MIMLYALAAPLVVLPLTAIAVSTKLGLSRLTVNTGPHGFTGILFAFTSCFANNGQSFASLSANTRFYNLTTALAMMVGRFGLAIPALSFAALFGRQRNTPSSSGTLPTDSFVFGLLLTTCLIIMVAPELFFYLGPRSNPRAIALGKIKAFEIHIACLPRALPNSVRSATSTCGGFRCSSRSPRSRCSASP